MKILMVVHSLRRGGAERVLLEVALGLRAKGHEVEVASWLDVDEYRDERYREVPRHFLVRGKEYRWPWGVPKAAEGLRRVAEKFRPDVMEIHTPTVAWVAAWANLGVPSTHILHGYGAITRRSSIKEWGTRAGDRLAQRRLNASLTVVSPPMTAVAAVHFGASARRFACVPNGVDLSRFHACRKAPEATPTILMLGTLSPNKGQSWGVRAIGAMLDCIPNVRLRVVGDGANRKALEGLVKEIGLGGKVELMGRREDVPELMAAAHVFWQLSESEGLPMVVLEAMATGLPVVGFDVRGTCDAVVDGKTGYLVPFGDFQAVAERTIRLLKDESTYRVLSHQARQRAERDFALEGMVDGHERVLRTATSAKNTNA